MTMAPNVGSIGCFGFGLFVKVIHRGLVYVCWRWFLGRLWLCLCTWPRPHARSGLVLGIVVFDRCRLCAGTSSATFTPSRADYPGRGVRDGSHHDAACSHCLRSLVLR